MLNHASIDDNLLYGYLDITPYLFVTVQVQWLLIYYLQPSKRSFAWGWVGGKELVECLLLCYCLNIS